MANINNVAAAVYTLTNAADMLAKAAKVLASLPEKGNPGLRAASLDSVIRGVNAVLTDLPGVGTYATTLNAVKTGTAIDSPAPAPAPKAAPAPAPAPAPKAAARPNVVPCKGGCKRTCNVAVLTDGMCVKCLEKATKPAPKAAAKAAPAPAAPAVDTAKAAPAPAPAPESKPAPKATAPAARPVCKGTKADGKACTSRICGPTGYCNAHKGQVAAAPKADKPAPAAPKADAANTPAPAVAPKAAPAAPAVAPKAAPAAPAAPAPKAVPAPKADPVVPGVFGADGKPLTVGQVLFLLGKVK